MMPTPLTDLAKVIRSKNSSPFELTLDIIVRRPADYEKLKAARAITPELVAAIYGIPVYQLHDVIYFDPAHAIKVTLPRRTASGSAGDADVYGAQQHAPLLGLAVDLDAAPGEG